MKAIVTGGAGFIGSHLCEGLIAKGHVVTALDNLSITDKNVPLLKKKGVRFVKADITDYRKVLDETKGKDIVFHLAAMNRAIKSINDPLKANDVNITGTLNVLESCRKNSVGRFVFTSSSSVHGSSKVFPRIESDRLQPTHPYGVGKAAAEYYTQVYCTLYGMKTTVLRYFSVYGPRQLGTIEYAAVIPKFIDKILKGEAIEVYGKGEQKRGFTYIGDVVEGTIKAAQSEKAVGETINISSGSEISVNDLITILEKQLGKKAKIKHAPEVKGDIISNQADVSKAKRLLNFEAKTSMEEGIKMAIEWYRKEHGK
jgi:nucleoside-diphosphate-sugar epimerase